MTATMTTTRSPRERELRGHDTERLELPMCAESNTGPKLCECGCGRATPLARASNARRGLVRGEPIRFIHGHNNRGRAFTDAHRGAMSKVKRGARNPAWRGGRVVDDGYVKIKVGARYEREHRLVVAEALGRDLHSGELVHHIDLDRSNNALDNLVVVTRPQHLRIHRYIEGRGMDPVVALNAVLGDDT